MPLPECAGLAGRNNCSVRQKAEIPIQSVELILRTARRKLGSLPRHALQRRRRDRPAAAIFYIAPPLRPSFPVPPPPFPLKTNNERDQSLAALRGRRRAGPSLGDGRATRKMFEGIHLLDRLLAPSVPLHLHSPSPLPSAFASIERCVFALVHVR